ncbi:TAXI family TRAP transporter solute-binding subunit [Pseudomonas sp. RIT-PI-AD]|uniref:TAXI family TRAP transporter solute-binding subunit n=1 Tax=Pseudomonas sp. RIT-PI-AD TaxID=3035294 RepID=UPI0021DA16B8|nr:TAXI family TRAP transporter solute-binding subunit [Pseudomonas sp. RIT-PI-AD]
MKMLNDVKMFVKAHLWLIPILVILVGVFFWALAPAPPSHLTMATGGEGGGYHDFGKRLQERLKREDIDLQLVPTSGSLDNLKRLLDGQVEIALVQSGTEQILNDGDRGRLHGLGAMYREPLWLFQRSGLGIDRLSDLAGKRVAIGVDGTGTQAVVNSLLEANQMQNDAAWQAIGGRDAADALVRGDVDAAFFVAPPQNALIRDLAASDQLQLVSFRRAAAYEARFPFLSSVNIPEGLLNLATNSPDQDVITLSPMATLVANGNLHPALTPMILEAARDVLKEGNMLDEANTFPKADPITFTLTKEADNYYRNGPPYLQRYLPFKIASLVDRYIVLLIPFIAILLPLFKSLSPLYEWRVRSRIYKWYRYLHEIDDKIHAGMIRSALEDEILALQAVQDELSQVEVPLSYSHELYELHLHVRYEMTRLRGMQQEMDAHPDTPPVI